ncbi:hypothetical protein Ddye_015626, partial [Dipteronia dyeriana]
MELSLDPSWVYPIKPNRTFTTTAYNNVLKAKPNAKKWRHTPIHHYDKLSELFAKDRANGECAISAKEKVQQWERERSPNQVVDVEHLDEVNNNCSKYFSQQYNIQPTSVSK